MVHFYPFWAAVPFLIAAEAAYPRVAFSSFQPSIATGGALFTRRESSEGDLRGCDSSLEMKRRLIQSGHRPALLQRGESERLQTGNSVRVSHSCSGRNGVIADAAYPPCCLDSQPASSLLVKARGAKQ